MTRTELREVACKIIYETYILENAKVDYDINSLVKEEIENTDDFVLELINGVKNNQKELSKLANRYLVNWEIDRLSKMDKAIISVAIYELKYTDTAYKIVIDEALNLSHKYSDDNVTKMINAMLDGIYKNECEQ